jgi:hypothetical protein
MARAAPLGDLGCSRYRPRLLAVALYAGREISRNAASSWRDWGRQFVWTRWMRPTMCLSKKRSWTYRHQVYQREVDLAIAMQTD